MEKGCLMTSLMSNDKEICMTVHVKCRHILAVEREHLQLVKSGPYLLSGPIRKMYSSALFFSAFSSYSIAMPSTEEITDTGSGKFSAIFTVPHMKRTCGRLLLMEVK